MNTSKTQDLKPFRMNTYKKRGRGDPRPHTYSSILSDLELSSRPAAVVRGGGDAHAFYRRLQDLHEPVRVGIEATGPIYWFERLLDLLNGDESSVMHENLVSWREDRADDKKSHFTS
jgi:hypothetical protein